MTTRCTWCNAKLDFRNRRGAKLADHRCTCGGSFEMLWFITAESGRSVYRNRADEKFTIAYGEKKLTPV